MEMFEIVLIMLILIGLSNVLNRFIPFIPVPLFQIVLGTGVALLPTGIHMELNTELFLLMFIAPLLYNDGKRTPREELWNLRSPILLLALGLVFVTVFAGGYLIHWLIPTMPMPAAFALAAILSPTDAVAVSALAGRISLPKGILRLLEGESLVNDASGLVAFKFAVAAMVTGTFSIGEATWSFIYIAVGGFLCGVVVSFLIVWLRVFLRRLGMEDVTIHMLLQLLTPFVIYLFAEELGFSGILAVVAGGIVHAIERDRTESIQAELQVVSKNTWSVIIYILNGLVFVIMGLQIPDATATIWQNPDYSNFQVLGFIGIISLSLILIRFIWVYLFWEGSWLLGSGEQMGKPKLMSSVLISLSGVRGAVTLAAALSIPYVISGGAPFPERDLIIFISAGVILFSLVIASVMLPLLSQNSSEHAAEEAKCEDEAKVALLKAGILAIREQTTPENSFAANLVVAEYENRLRQLENNEEEILDVKRHKQEIKLRMIGLEAERAAIQKMIDNEELTGELAQRIEQTMNQMEMIISSRVKMVIMVSWIRLRRLLFKQFYKKQAELHECDLQRLRQVRVVSSQAAIKAIKGQMNVTNRVAGLKIIQHYKDLIARLEQQDMTRSAQDEWFSEHKNELRIAAIQAERDEIQHMFQRGEITRAYAAKLRQYINYMEAGILYSDLEEE